MPLAIDHLVVAAATLEEGARWVEERLGVAPVPGGKHALMGTHNRLLNLGAGRYLEVIAVDPQALAPARPRWFSLDEPAMRERLAQGPALVHWVARTDDIERSVAEAPIAVGEILDLERGEYRWRIAVPHDGRLLHEGVFPTFIQWTGERHPAAALPECGCQLERIVLPELQLLLAIGLDPEEPVWVHGAEKGIAAHVRAPSGLELLP